jgi:hypothetical protein
MDLFDLIPIVPPSLPGERSAALNDTLRFAAGVGSTLLPTIDFLLVLFAGLASPLVVPVVVLPLASGGVTFLVSRLVSTPIAWALVLAMGCAMFCLIGDGCALLLHGLLRFFQEF